MTGTGPSSLRRHGGRLDAARRAYPAAPEPWLDLSTGINPVAWTPPAGLLTDPAPLPDVAALAGLEAAAARAFGTAPERVAAVPGSEIALRMLPQLGVPRPIVAAAPGYGTHAAVADEVVPFEQLDAVAGRRCTVLLARPNNPDGRVPPPEWLAALLARQRNAGGWLAVDEAFADAMPPRATGPVLPAEAPVIAFRSFGKFFGLAGVRLGFVVGPAEPVARCRALLGDWPVSAQAIGWGRAAYADTAWMDATRTALAARAAELDALLAGHGLCVRGDCPLFRLVEDGRAPELFDGLARAGILTRPFAHRPDWLRFGLPGSAAALDRLDRALGGLVRRG